MVAADPHAVWEALLGADLIEVGKRTPLAGLLGAERVLPELADRFRDLGEPGHAKTVYALSVRPRADGRGLLSGLMRTATTGEHARRWFRRYWTFGVGSGAHILVHALLEMVRETAEGAQAAVAGQAR